MFKYLKHYYKLLLGIITIFLLTGCAPYYSSCNTVNCYQNTYKTRYHYVPRTCNTPCYSCSDTFIPYYR